MTPFGEGIRRVYIRELTSGRVIRWSAQKVSRAQRFADRSWRDPGDHAAARDEVERRLTREEASEGQVDEVCPPQVASAQDQCRWHLCVVCARGEHPKLGSVRLWDVAVEMLNSEATNEELELAAARALAPSSERPPLRFRRTDLGMLVPTARGGTG